MHACPQLSGLGSRDGLGVVDHPQRREVIPERVLERIRSQSGGEREDPAQVRGELAERLEVPLVRGAQAGGLAGPGIARPSGAVVQHLLEIAGRPLAAARCERLRRER